MRVIVTGGGGFLGSAIVRQLLARGDVVRILARNQYPDLEALGAESLSVDLCRHPDLESVLTGFDAIIHTAAKAGVWGAKESYWSINFEATLNLLNAAQNAGIQRFVHTSSPSAVWSGGDEAGLTEAECPYPKRHLTHYSESKAAAERFVLQSNNAQLPTTALRPHLIYGPNDPHLIPRILQRAHRLRIVGTGKNKVGLTYVENAAAAHLQALDALRVGSPNAGKAYFITDSEPVVIWEWINNLLKALGRRPILRRISARKAFVIGAVLEFFWRILPLKGEPPMTRFVAKQLSTHHHYDLNAAIEDFDYCPVVEADTALAQTIAFFTEEGD